ncbi:MAG: phosphoribosylglycinamide formyltransferase [Candidatus Omnitrophica bacterium]|nr:phosphoribosylglycinamide formyltransferase [Candidatus Omnitrophota bacterium]
MKNIAVFCSGNGTNFQAIINAARRGYIRADISLMVCDNPDAYALKRAKRAGVEVFLLTEEGFKTREDYDRAVIRKLEEKSIDLVVLAGFMRLLSPRFVQKYKNRILNIHPALLPSFKGTSGVKDALDYGVKITGPTVHFVDEGLDSGPIIIQERVAVRDDDTEETLARRIHKKEHIIYPKAVKWFVEGKLKIEGRRVKQI